MPKNEYGKWAFLAVAALSIVGAFWPALLMGFGVMTLFVLGLVVGIMNVEKSETTIGILVAIAFPLIAVGLNTVPQVSTVVGPILLNLAVALGGAAVVVVGKAMYNTYGS